MIYAYVLVEEEQIHFGAWTQYSLSSELLRTNKIIHDEAVEVLYSQNLFEFVDHDADENLDLFLQQISPNSAMLIRHIRVDFPEFQRLDLGSVTLKQESMSILENLKSCCGNLRTLTTSLSSTSATEHRLDSLDHPKIVSEAFDLVDTHFRAITPPHKNPSPNHDDGPTPLAIVVEVYTESVNGAIRRKMESLGWILDVSEEMEVEIYDHSYYGSDRDDDDWDRENSDYGDDDDDYDIDNDSDFWRRAGD